MMSANQLREWLNGIEDNADVAVDDGGLCIVELDEHGEQTGNYIELGGIPLPKDSEEEDDEETATHV